MCAACALTAMAGAAGARSWLQAHHSTWLTEQRLKRATVGIFVVATLGSTVTLSGASSPVPDAHGQGEQAAARQASVR
jgi:hypothetical protein